MDVPGAVRGMDEEEGKLFDRNGSLYCLSKGSSLNEMKVGTGGRAAAVGQEKN